MVNISYTLGQALTIVREAEISPFDPKIPWLPRPATRAIERFLETHRFSEIVNETAPLNYYAYAVNPSVERFLLWCARVRGRVTSESSPADHDMIVELTSCLGRLVTTFGREEVDRDVDAYVARLEAQIAENEVDAKRYRDDADRICERVAREWPRSALPVLGHMIWSLIGDMRAQERPDYWEARGLRAESGMGSPPPATRSELLRILKAFSSDPRHAQEHALDLARDARRRRHLAEAPDLIGGLTAISGAWWVEGFEMGCELYGADANVVTLEK